MSVLKDLVWKDGDICSHIKASARSPLHGYFVSQTSDNDEVSAGYYENGGRTTRYATGFATIEDAKTWCWNHYNEKMQPYVKPSPTWIDVNKREPTEKGDYLIRDYQGRVAMGKYDKGFYMESGGEKWGCVQYWMPIPEFSTMQNLHNASEVVK